MTIPARRRLINGGIVNVGRHNSKSLGWTRQRRLRVGSLLKPWDYRYFGRFIHRSEIICAQQKKMVLTMVGQYCSLRLAVVAQTFYLMGVSSFACRGAGHPPRSNCPAFHRNRLSQELSQ